MSVEPGSPEALRQVAEFERDLALRDLEAARAELQAERNAAARGEAERPERQVRALERIATALEDLAICLPVELGALRGLE